MFDAKIRSSLLVLPSSLWRLSPFVSNFEVRRNFRVTVIGAYGGIGKLLSMLLVYNSRVTRLMLHDLMDVRGLAKDLSHISRPVKVRGVHGIKKVGKAVKGADLVIITAGVPRKPGMTRDELFDINAKVVSSTVQAVAQNSSNALIAIVTNPINALVPMAAEILKQCDVHDPKRLFGVTTLDVVRAEKFIAGHMHVDPRCVKIPVIGGHTATTIMPIISQCKPAVTGDADCIAAIIKRVQMAGDEIVKAKAGKGSATLSMAYACNRFVDALLKGLNCEESPIECAYVESDVTEVPFFSTPLSFGPMGIKKNHGIPKLDDCEKQTLKATLESLKTNIEQGICFAKK